MHAEFTIEGRIRRSKIMQIVISNKSIKDEIALIGFMLFDIAVIRVLVLGTNRWVMLVISI